MYQHDEGVVSFGCRSPCTVVGCVIVLPVVETLFLARRRTVVQFSCSTSMSGYLQSTSNSPHTVFVTTSSLLYVPGTGTLPVDSWPAQKCYMESTWGENTSSFRKNYEICNNDCIPLLIFSVISLVVDLSLPGTATQPFGVLF